MPLPGHGAQISTRAPTKGYVQTGAMVPEHRAPGTGHRTPGTEHRAISLNRAKVIYSTDVTNENTGALCSRSREGFSSLSVDAVVFNTFSGYEMQ